ncbi:MAG: RdgB/HAM1 family non-canonical purine NTP pyrophosphatase [Clostridia bacterium]
MELVIASNNKNKIKEIHQIMGNFFDKIYSLSDLNIDIDVEETGTTFFENALIKAKAISKITNMVTLSDDSGLVVDALNGAPGVYSARYAGDDCNQANNNALLLKNMKNKKNRKAYFVCHLVMYYPDGHYLDCEGKVCGKILDKEVGECGFGYDPLFYCNELGKSFGIAKSIEKNEFSHRGRALMSLKKLFLEQNQHIKNKI